MKIMSYITLGLLYATHDYKSTLHILTNMAFTTLNGFWCSLHFLDEEVGALL